MGEWIRVRDTAKDASLAASPPGAGGVWVNHGTHHDLGDEAIRLINNSRRSLIVASPLINDTRVADALIAAKDRGVRVKVITELRDNRGRKHGVRYPTRGFEEGDANTLDAHFATIRWLARHRIACRAPHFYAHPKLFFSDDETLLLSSMNLTPNSLGWGPRPSLEAGLRVAETHLASAWARVLGEWWDGCPFRQHLLGGDISLQQEPGSAPTVNALRQPLSPTLGMTWSFPPDHRNLRDMLAEMCRGARRRILLAAFSCYEIDRIPALNTGLLDALKRGIEVIIIVRPNNDPLSDPSVRLLQACGLKLYGMDNLHAKGILADASACAIFSANLNPFSLESDLESAHIECGICEQSEEGQLDLLRSYAQFLVGLVEDATHIYG